MLKYGIIGLGNLGEKIARNLINKGFSVKIFDKNQKNINKLVKLGAINSKSISEVANEVDGLITCLPSPKISTEVMAGVDGAILYMKSGSTWIETSTTDINELKKVSEIAKEKKIRKPKIAVVLGDDVLNYMSEKDILNSPTMEGLDIKNSKITAANVYLGAFPIANALKKDVDIVIVGRSVDSALALGPLIHEFDWDAKNLDMLSSGTICGHLLECGAQVTGAYFADPGFKDVPDLFNVGFPIAEFHENGDFFITKPKNTGGLVNKATITEQLLYETHNPNQYIVPDVVADMSCLNLIEKKTNKVLVKGAVGHQKPELLKATICSESGFMGEAEMSYAGPNALQRAKLAIEVIEKRIQKIGLQGKTRFDIIGAGSVHFSSSEENTYNNELDGDYRIRSAGFFENKEDAEQFVAETYSLYCSGPSAGGGARTSITKETSTASILIDRNIVEPQIKIEII